MRKRSFVATSQSCSSSSSLQSAGHNSNLYYTCIVWQVQGCQMRVLLKRQQPRWHSTARPRAFAAHLLGSSRPVPLIRVFHVFLEALVDAWLCRLRQVGSLRMEALHAAIQVTTARGGRVELRVRSAARAPLDSAGAKTHAKNPLGAACVTRLSVPHLRMDDCPRRPAARSPSTPAPPAALPPLTATQASSLPLALASACAILHPSGRRTHPFRQRLTHMHSEWSPPCCESWMPRGSGAPPWRRTWPPCSASRSRSSGGIAAAQHPASSSCRG